MDGELEVISVEQFLKSILIKMIIILITFIIMLKERIGRSSYVFKIFKMV